MNFMTCYTVDRLFPEVFLISHTMCSGRTLVYVIFATSQPFFCTVLSLQTLPSWHYFGEGGTFELSDMYKAWAWLLRHGAQHCSP